MSRRFCPCHAGGHAAIALSRMLSDGSGTIEASVTSNTWPRPWQCGHAPCAVFGEKSSAYSIGCFAGYVAGARIQHAHEARQRRDAADRRPHARRAALLLQRDRGRQAFDRIDIGHADLVDQAPRIRRDRFEVAPLRLGVERAEGERRLAGARHAGEHDERIARDVDVDVLEVVLARAADADVGVGGGRAGGAGRLHAPSLAARTRTASPADARGARSARATTPAPSIEYVMPLPP